MTDLISRQAALGAIDAIFPADPMKTEYAQGIACGAALAKIYIEQLPTAQPEHPEIIRCRDCKYRDDDDFCIGRGCPNLLVPNDGFCDKGERSE